MLLYWHFPPRFHIVKFGSYFMPVRILQNLDFVIPLIQSFLPAYIPTWSVFHPISSSKRLLHSLSIVPWYDSGNLSWHKLHYLVCSLYMAIQQWMILYKFVPQIHAFPSLFPTILPEPRKYHPLSHSLYKTGCPELSKILYYILFYQDRNPAENIYVRSFHDYSFKTQIYWYLTVSFILIKKWHCYCNT